MELGGLCDGDNFNFIDTPHQVDSFNDECYRAILDL
jgi:hypothetical protein